VFDICNWHVTLLFFAYLCKTSLWWPIVTRLETFRLLASSIIHHLLEMSLVSQKTNSPSKLHWKLTKFHNFWNDFWVVHYWRTFSSVWLLLEVVHETRNFNEVSKLQLFNNLFVEKKVLYLWYITLQRNDPYLYYSNNNINWRENVVNNVDM